MEEKYTTEGIIENFFEDYFEEEQEEYKKLLGEMLKEEKINDVVMNKYVKNS